MVRASVSADALTTIVETHARRSTWCTRPPSRNRWWHCSSCSHGRVVRPVYCHDACCVRDQHLSGCLCGPQRVALLIETASMMSVKMLWRQPPDLERQHELVCVVDGSISGREMVTKRSRSRRTLVGGQAAGASSAPGAVAGGLESAGPRDEAVLMAKRRL